MKKNNAITAINSISILVFLISQLVLSALILSKLIRLNQIFSSLTDQNPVDSDVPQFIPTISIDNNPSQGSPDAPITIIAFLDFECPACGAASNYMQQILQDYEGKVFWVIRDFPLKTIHPHAFQAALAANCAGNQGKYWEMFDLLFANQQNLSRPALESYAANLDLDLDAFNECLENKLLADEINNDIRAGMEYQVSATPTYFINGYRVTGGSIEQIRNTIDSLLITNEEVK